MRPTQTAVLLSVTLGLSVSQARALTINATYNTTITGDPNALTIESTIQSAINVYQGTFTNSTIVNLTFGEMTSGLGQSSTYGTNINYSQYYSQLFQDKTAANNDTSYFAFLPNQTNNPVNGNSQIRVTTANLRTIGLNYVPPTGQPDSTITLNTSLMNISRSGAQDPSKYDLSAVVSHEIDEALGFGSALNGLSNGAASPTGAINGLDLYRYSANGVRSFDTNANTNAYFSIDGGQTGLVRFNQQAGGDYQDWYSYFGGQTPRVQNAFGTPGSQPNLGVAEITGLRVLGYNIAAAPEPSAPATLALGALGIASLITIRRRRGQTKAA